MLGLSSLVGFSSCNALLMFSFVCLLLQDSYSPYINDVDVDLYFHVGLGDCLDDRNRGYDYFYVQLISTIPDCANYCSITAGRNSAYVGFEYDIRENALCRCLYSDDRVPTSLPVDIDGSYRYAQGLGEIATSDGASVRFSCYALVSGNCRIVEY